MACELRKPGFFATRWGPIGLVALASGCVPDVPLPGGGTDGGVPAGPYQERSGVTGAPSAGTGGSNTIGGDPANPDNPAAANPTGSRSEGDMPERSAGGSIDPVSAETPAMTPYRCQADSDCAESLTCVAEECVFIPPERFPSTTVQTTGGGLARGAGLRLQLRIGAPPPVGRMSGGGHHLTLGPLSGH